MPFILDPPLYSSPCDFSTANGHIDPSTSSNMPFFASLRAKARKSGINNNRSSTNQTSNSADMKRSHLGSIFSKSPSTRRPPPGLQSNNPFADHSVAPPAYSAAPPIQPVSQAPIPRSNASPSEDTDFSFLSTFDTCFLIDDSGSMAGRCWRETAEAIKTITPICTEHDADGIDIYFLNARDSEHFHHVTSPTDVEEIFGSVYPRGGTPTGSRLHAILKPYLRDLEMKGEENVKPLNIIVITDGQASDDVESVILSAARKLDRLDAPAWQIGIQFFQVGEDPGAKEMLVELDDRLALKGVRDMVDTVPWVGTTGTGLNGKGILKCVLGAVVRRHDDDTASSAQLRPEQSKRR